MPRTETPQHPMPPREDVSFPSGADCCSGWLYRPEGPASGIVVMAHGLGAVRWMRLGAFAEQFVKLGLAVLIFDYRYIGTSGGWPRQLIDVNRQIDDWHAALAFARGLPGIDHRRIALWGSAFSGGHVLRVAAEDGRIQALISTCPYLDGPPTVRARIHNGRLSASVLAFLAAVDIVGSWIGARPVLIPLVGKPWMPAFITAPEAVSGSSRIAPPGARLSASASRSMRFLPSMREEMARYINLDNDSAVNAKGSVFGELSLPDGTFITKNAIAARLFLHLPFYRPFRKLSRLSLPILLCVCEYDGIVPAETAIRAAENLDNVQLKSYPCDHFGIYVEPDFEHAVLDQINFLAQHMIPEKSKE